MAELQLPPSIRDARGQAIEGIVNRLAQIDLSPILIYRIDSVRDSALPFLAWQFDVADALFQLLAPGADQRQLIKSAIALKRKVGTPYAIKTALANLGWTNATILEGQNSWGGTSWPSDEGWAVCRILIQLGMATAADFSVWDPTINYPAGALVTFNDGALPGVGNFFWASAPARAGTQPQFANIDDVTDVDDLSDVDELVQAPWQIVNPADFIEPVTLAQVEQIIAAFYFFAPKRCWLDSVRFEWPLMTDSLDMTDTASFGSVDSIPQMTDVLSMTFPPMADPILNSVLYDAEFDYSGVTHADELVGICDGPLTMNGVAIAP